MGAINVNVPHLEAMNCSNVLHNAAKAWGNITKCGGQVSWTGVHSPRQYITSSGVAEGKKVQKLCVNCSVLDTEGTIAVRDPRSRRRDPE